MINPIVSLAFSIYSKKGAYALLLGSGISRASGIPTGCEIVLDLIRQIAKLEGEGCEPDPATWYCQKYHAEPDYSRLLDEIAKTQPERQQLLRSYFEPTNEEREQGIKLPTPAHKEIAKLASAGFIRVIISTNFDRLLEKALEDIGIVPTVLSTSDQIRGALPLTHSGVTLIKLHGDYRDTRIRNTTSELTNYEPEFDRLLDRIFDEYGLLVCGWSCDWDIALRAAIERCPTRRFSTYWTVYGSLSENAEALAKHRGAERIPISGADNFFRNLGEKVRALCDLAAPHPLSAKMASATIKRYLVEPKDRIRLHDLIFEETEKLIYECRREVFPGDSSLPPLQEIMVRLGRYEALCENLASIFATGCHWCDKEQGKLWSKSLQRLYSSVEPMGGLDCLLELRHYPPLFLLYAGGISAVAAGNYEALASLLIHAKVKNNEKEVPLIYLVNTFDVMDVGLSKKIPSWESRHTPLSDHLFEKLRDPLRDYLLGNDEYQNAFDRFEYFLGASYSYFETSENKGRAWGPIGCFAWRGRRSLTKYMPKIFEDEVEKDGIHWRPAQAGFLGGSFEHAKPAVSKFNAHVASLPFY